MYVGDCASTYRNNMFRDYEKHPYGTFEGNGQQPQQQRKSYYTMVQGNILMPFCIVLRQSTFCECLEMFIKVNKRHPRAKRCEFIRVLLSRPTKIFHRDVYKMSCIRKLRRYKENLISV